MAGRRRQHRGSDALHRRDADADIAGGLVDAGAGLERRSDGPLGLVVNPWPADRLAAPPKRRESVTSKNR
jgi:hypothetical protein